MYKLRRLFRLFQQCSIIQFLFSIGYRTIDATDYIVTGNSVAITQREYLWMVDHYYLAFTTPKTATVAFTGGNITSQSLSGVAANSGYSPAHIIYDTKRNPFEVIKLKYPCLETFSYYQWLLQKNN